MMIGRRQLFGLTATGLTLAALAPPARACSLIVPNRTPYSDRKCRQALRGFVELLNEASSLADVELQRRADEFNIHIEPEWVDDILVERSNEFGSEYTFLKEFRFAGGKLDPKAIEIEEVNLIRRLGNRATYQFTLKRYSYHPADPEGCNGLFVHGEYYGYERTACLATFTANRLRTLRRFPEWYVEGEA